MDRLNQRQDDQERCLILDWLTPINYTPQQVDFICRKRVGTGRWLLNSAEFQKWLGSGKKTLYCTGIPGVGKTILTSVVVNHLTSWFSGEQMIGIAYVCCNFQWRGEQTAHALLASLLKQLAQGQSSLPRSVYELYDLYRDKRTRPSFDEISGTLHYVATTYSRVFIIVDALNECQASDGCRTRFLSEIFRLQTNCEASLFVTSRIILELQEKFVGHIFLTVHASKTNIRSCLDWRVLELPRFVIGNLELQEEIKSKITEAAGEMSVTSYFFEVKGKPHIILGFYSHSFIWSRLLERSP